MYIPSTSTTALSAYDTRKTHRCELFSEFVYLARLEFYFGGTGPDTVRNNRRMTPKTQQNEEF
jgi:hypothetical protein